MLLPVVAIVESWVCCQENLHQRWVAMLEPGQDFCWRGERIIGPGLEYSHGRGGNNGRRVIREDRLTSCCFDPSDMELVVEKDFSSIVIILDLMVSSSSPATYRIRFLWGVLCRAFGIVWPRLWISGGLLLLTLDPGRDPLACDCVGAFTFGEGLTSHADGTR